MVRRIDVDKVQHELSAGEWRFVKLLARLREYGWQGGEGALTTCLEEGLITGPNLESLCRAMEVDPADLV